MANIPLLKYKVIGFLGGDPLRSLLPHSEAALFLSDEGKHFILGDNNMLVEFDTLAYLDENHASGREITYFPPIEVTDYGGVVLSYENLEQVDSDIPEPVIVQQYVTQDEKQKTLLNLQIAYLNRISKRWLKYGVSFNDTNTLDDIEHAQRASSVTDKSSTLAILLLQTVVDFVRVTMHNENPISLSTSMDELSYMVDRLAKVRQKL